MQVGKIVRGDNVEYWGRGGGKGNLRLRLAVHKRQRTPEHEGHEISFLTSLYRIAGHDDRLRRGRGDGPQVVDKRVVVVPRGARGRAPDRDADSL